MWRLTKHENATTRLLVRQLDGGELLGSVEGVFASRRDEVQVEREGDAASR